MRAVFSAVTGVGVAAALSMAAFAQQTPSPQGAAPGGAQQPGQPRATQQSQDGQQVTISGCIQREADYRKAQGAGGAGVAGTGLGAGNEFVLTNASMSGGGAPGAAGEKPTGTTGVAAAYELTGSGEGQAGQFVGKRVEISGMLKPAEVGAGGATGGATAGAPPRGVDVTSKDLKLRELEVTSVKAATSGSCPTN